MTVEENKKLIDEYPFLIPRNVWTSEVVENYDYSFTLLDDLEDGWKIRFGIPFCDDLLDVLTKTNCLQSYHIFQIKEKFGTLRWYDNAPPEWGEHMSAWEYISEHTCKKCGEFPVPMRNDGWLSPWCDRCFGSWASHAYTEEEKKRWTCKEMGTDRILEYITYDSSLTGRKYIDMKPYYDKIGYKYKNLITKEEAEEYTNYHKVLQEYMETSGIREITDPNIIPYEIQEMNPFKER